MLALSDYRMLMELGHCMVHCFTLRLSLDSAGDSDCSLPDSGTVSVSCISISL